MLRAAAAVLAAAAGMSYAADDERPGAPPRDALVELGRRLFHDPAASRDGREACSSCHDAAHGWSDPRPRSVASDGSLLRHSQPVTDLAATDRGSGFHWDGEFATVRELIVHRAGRTRDALVAAARREFARPEIPAARDLGARRTTDSARGSYGVMGDDVDFPFPVDLRVGADDRYGPAFHAAFGSTDVTSERIVEAIEAFTLSLRTGRNRLDRHLAGESGALGPEELRGLAVFRGEGGCATCHLLDVDADGRALLTDGRFHDTGIARRAGGADRGRAATTRLWDDRFAVKTPSLRDVAKRRTYMHDGSLTGLTAVIDWYATKAPRDDGADPHARAIRIAPGSRADLAAFLRALSAPDVPGALPSRAAPLRRELQVMRVDGKSAAHLLVRIEPAGQRFGSALRHAAVDVRTDAQGRLSFVFPDSTHVRLSARGLSIGGGALVPDVVPEMMLYAAPTHGAHVILDGADLPDHLDAGFFLLAGARSIDALVTDARASVGDAAPIHEPMDPPEPPSHESSSHEPGGSRVTSVLESAPPQAGRRRAMRNRREPSGTCGGCGTGITAMIPVALRKTAQLGPGRAAFLVALPAGEPAGPRLLRLNVRRANGDRESFEAAVEIGAPGPLVSQLFRMDELRAREALDDIRAAEIAGDPAAVR